MQGNGKRLFGSAIALAMFLSVFTAACGGSEEAAPNGAEDSPGKSEEPYELTFLGNADAGAKTLKENDRIVQEINKRLNIKLKVKLVPQYEWDKVNVAIASGDLPDVVTINYPSDSVLQWIKEGIVIPLTPYLKQMPTVQHKIENGLKWSSVDGNYYGYPFVTLDIDNYNLAYRQDWMDKLGIAPPRTLDDFYNVLKAFTTKDPDGNGKDDTYGMSPSNTARQFNFVFFGFGMPYSDWALDAQGNVIPKHEHPSFKQGIEYLRKLYGEKLIDPEFVLNDANIMKQKFYQSKAGVIDTPLFRNLDIIESSLKKVVPSGKVGFYEAPSGPGGRGLGSVPKGGIFTAITKGSKNPAKAAQFIEFMVSPEGRDLLQLGIEGVHYTKENGKLVYNLEERAKDNFSDNGWSHPLAWGSFAWPLSENYLPETEPQRDRAIETVVVSSKHKRPNLIYSTTKEELEHGSVVTEIYNQYFMEMMVGKIDIDTGIAEMSKKWRQQGGEQILKSVNEAYKTQKQ